MSPAELTAWATVAIAVVTAGVGATTCFLVWHGIREMRRSSDERARDRKAVEEADIRRHETAAERERLRHEEVMEALTAQNRRHEEVMEALTAQNRRFDAQIAGFDAQNRRLDAQIAGFDAQNRRLDAQTDALKALLLRMGPVAAPAK